MRKIERQMNRAIINCTEVKFYLQHLSFTIKAWKRHVTGYYETNYPHIPGLNQKQFWNLINGK